MLNPTNNGTFKSYFRVRSTSEGSHFKLSSLRYQLDAQVSHLRAKLSGSNARVLMDKRSDVMQQLSNLSFQFNNALQGRNKQHETGTPSTKNRPSHI